MEAAVRPVSSTTKESLVSGYVKVYKVMLTGDGTNNGHCRFVDGGTSTGTLIGEVRCGPNEAIILDWAGDYVPAFAGVFADVSNARAHAYVK